MLGFYLLSRLHYAPIRGVADTPKDNNPNNDKSLCGKLGALINQVNANERRGILKQNKFELRTQAEDIRDQVGLLIIIERWPVIR